MFIISRSWSHMLLYEGVLGGDLGAERGDVLLQGRDLPLAARDLCVALLQGLHHVWVRHLHLQGRGGHCRLSHHKDMIMESYKFQIFKETVSPFSLSSIVSLDKIKHIKGCKQSITKKKDMPL